MDYPFDLADLEKQLARDEGRRLDAYQDSRSFWTIGIGHLIDPGAGGQAPEDLIWGGAPGVLSGTCTISDDTCDALFRQDIDRCCANLDARLPWWRSLDAARAGVLANMGFNLGVGDGKHGLSSFTTFLALIQRKDFAGAAADLVGTAWARQVGPRAQRLEQQIRTGVWQ